MAFKQVKEYIKDKYGKMLVLPNDKDSVDIIILYRSASEVLLANTHYMKSSEYEGYVHCLERGCPACNHITPRGQKGIRIQPRLFIPVYRIPKEEGEVGEIMFFDRSIKFEGQLQKEVLSNYPNPSEYVFQLTRHGEAGNIETYYTFSVLGMNKVKSFDEICKENGAEIDANGNVESIFPKYYENICREIDAATMTRWLQEYAETNVDNGGNYIPPSNLNDYTVTPRAAVTEAPQFVSVPSNDNMLPDITVGDEDVNF